MSSYGQPNPPSKDYNLGKSHVLHHLRVMEEAMQKMGAEHVKFHEGFTDAQKRLEEMKKKYGTTEFDVEVIRATALDPYLSDGNLPKVMAIGRLELDKAWKEFKQEEQKLDHLQKKTAKLVDDLSGDRVASQS